MQLTMTMKIVCSLVLFALVRGQENTCCPPPQWEASIKAHGVAFSPLGTDVYTVSYPSSVHPLSLSYMYTRKRLL